MKNAPVIIVFFGVDGSGKSTQALMLNETLKKKGISSVLLWNRREPLFSKIPARLVKRFILKEREKSEGRAYPSVKKGRERLFRNRFFRSTWLELALAEYLLMTHFKNMRHHKGERVIIFDRYLQDALVDFSASCSFSEEVMGKLLRSPIARCFPVPDLLLFIDVDAEVGAARKKDGTSYAYLADRVPVYRRFAEWSGAVRVDGTLRPEEINKIILQETMRVLQKKIPPSVDIPLRIE